jgi:tRNA A37 threonylcarbamoyladenosine dehydratase
METSTYQIMMNNLGTTECLCYVKQPKVYRDESNPLMMVGVDQIFLQEYGYLINVIDQFQRRSEILETHQRSKEPLVVIFL